MKEQILNEELEEALKKLEHSSLLGEDAFNIKCKHVNDLTLGKAVATFLFKQLENVHSAKILTANQMGLNYNVFVMNIREPLYFINPKILDESGEQFMYLESDNSFPEKLANTYRFGRILVSASNFKSPIWFGVKLHQLSLLKEQSALIHPVVEECAYIQHSIDSLNGITMFDRNTQYSYKQKTYQRNEIITIIKNDKLLQIKYKKLNEYLNNGWKLK